MKKRPLTVDEQAAIRREADDRRFLARLAHLDGRNKRARVLNREADRLSRKLSRAMPGYITRS